MLDTSLKINSFTGMYRWLSNFWYVNGITVEHEYQAAKAASIEDQKKILNAKTPGQAKRLGKKIKIREDWKSIKINVMRALLYKKFLDPEMKRLLLDTDDIELIEGNIWGDTFWGVCNGKGQNVLGKLLMEVREAIK